MTLFRRITNEADYDLAMEVVGFLVGQDQMGDTPHAEDLVTLAILIEEYEDRMFPTPVTTAVEAIRFRMEQQELTRKDLEPVLGSRGHISDILNGRRRLSLRNIEMLHRKLSIPLEPLVMGNIGVPHGEDG